MLDKTQIGTFFTVTGLTVALTLLAGTHGFPNHFRTANPEVWAYAFAESVGRSIICLIVYIVMVVFDLIGRRKRFLGWMLSAFLSVLTIFILMYLLPSPKPLF